MNSKPPKPRREATEVDNLAGRVKHDDRGNAVWEWASNTDGAATDSTQPRLKKLDNPTLALTDEAVAPPGAVKQNPHGTVKGYSPYDSGILAKPDAERPRRKDLRKLSEWLKLKKQAAGDKSE